MHDSSQLSRYSTGFAGRCDAVGTADIVQMYALIIHLYIRSVQLYTPFYLSRQPSQTTFFPKSRYALLYVSQTLSVVPVAYRVCALYTSQNLYSINSIHS